jgi:hypothetical protein
VVEDVMHADIHDAGGVALRWLSSEATRALAAGAGARREVEEEDRTGLRERARRGGRRAR